MSVEHSLFSYFGHIEVAQFHDPILGEEDVSALNVSVTNLEIMESFYSSDHLNKVEPYLFFIKHSIFLFSLSD